MTDDIRTCNAKGSREGELGYWDAWDGEKYLGWIMGCYESDAKCTAQNRWPKAKQVRVQRAISDD